jgi:hypothetical protein
MALPAGIRYVPDYHGTAEAVFGLEMVTAVLQDVADEVLKRAKELAAEAGQDDFAASLHMELQTRPKGRTQALVIADSDNAEAVEYGDTNTQRYRILGQAAGVQVFPS